MKGMICTLKPSNVGRFPILAALLWGACVYGQAYTITGRAFNEAGKKIGPVRIVLYDLEKRVQILFRYCDAECNITDSSNPNGSVGSVAGLCNTQRNVMGMMPHPE